MTDTANGRPKYFGWGGDENFEELAPLSQAARWLPARRLGRPTNPSTLWRWHRYGLRGRCLRCVRVGSVWCTSRRMLAEFFGALSEDDPTPAASPDRNETRQAAVEAELDRIGA